MLPVAVACGMLMAGGAVPRSMSLSHCAVPRRGSQLTRRANKYTLPYFQVVRAKMILLAAEGWGSGEIAARLDTRREVVEPVAQTLLRTTPGRVGRSGTSGPAPVFSPQTSSSRSRRWPVNCRPTLACRLSRWSIADVAQQARQCGLVAGISGQHGLALAQRRCDSTVAAPLLDLSPRSAVREQGGTHPRSVRAHWEGSTVGR